VELSAIVNAPVRLPAAVGVKVTEIVQLAPTATLEPQLLTWAKSPEAAIEVRVSAALPELISVTVCAALVDPVASAAKNRLAGDTLAAGADATPVPAKFTV
jgi:hypothetical protein